MNDKIKQLNEAYERMETIIHNFYAYENAVKVEFKELPTEKQPRIGLYLPLGRTKY